MSIDCYTAAIQMAAAIRTKAISSRELTELHLQRIEQANPRINAVVSLDPDRALKAAARADDQTAADESSLAPLHGLPFAFKDTHRTSGWRTTFGSPLMADHVPDADDLVVARLKAAGVVMLGKTNTPEWAAGSHTFNPVFGTTVNPYDASRSAGGSSGGAAAALASGMLPLAEGSDMGGSLRNPASFCNVVGLRPGLGRVPDWPIGNAWEMLGTAGPMARTVSDLALLLSVMAGPSPYAPLAATEPGTAFAPPLHGSLRGLRVAFSPDLGGAFAVEESVTSVLEAHRATFADAGAEVTETHPDVTGADEAFRTLRAWAFWVQHGQTLQQHPDGFKPALADNIRAGEHLTGDDVARAYAARTALLDRMRVFFVDHDLLVLPVSQVPPFPADQEYPTAINGQPQPSYLDWMRSSYLITMTGCPAISVPAGFTAKGWPVGIQIVAPHGAERRLLEAAYAFEQRTRYADRHPDL